MDLWKTSFQETIKKAEEEKRRENQLDKMLAPDEKQEVKQKLEEIVRSPRTNPISRTLTMSDIRSTKSKDDTSTAVSNQFTGTILKEKDEQLAKAGGTL